MKTATKAPVELVAIAVIAVGVRRRKSLGGLASLKRSIEAHGLFHPILVRNGNELVSGARRLEACRQLGWSTIPARRVDRLSDDERRAIELEENTERLALLDYEASKAKLAEIRQAEADAKREAETRSGSEQVSRPGKRGPARRPGSKRDVAERTGVSLAEQARVERHVELGEQYPFMRRPGWVQYRALQAGGLRRELQARPPGRLKDDGTRAHGHPPLLCWVPPHKAPPWHAPCTDIGAQLAQISPRGSASMPAMGAPNVEILSRYEIHMIVEQGARERLGVPAADMITAYRAGELPDPGAVADLLAYARLLSPEDPLSLGAPRP